MSTQAQAQAKLWETDYSNYYPNLSHVYYTAAIAEQLLGEPFDDENGLHLEKLKREIALSDGPQWINLDGVELANNYPSADDLVVFQIENSLIVEWLANIYFERQKSGGADWCNDCWHMGDDLYLFDDEDGRYAILRRDESTDDAPVELAKIDREDCLYWLNRGAKDIPGLIVQERTKELTRHHKQQTNTLYKQLAAYKDRVEADCRRIAELEQKVRILEGGKL